MCDCDVKKDCILIQVWDADKCSNDDLVGSVIYNFEELHNRKEKVLKKIKYGDKPRGYFSIFKCDIVPTMVDFIQNDCQFTMTVGIDFSGTIQTINSLHFQGNYNAKENKKKEEKEEKEEQDIDNLNDTYMQRMTTVGSQYLQALRSIVPIVTDYDTDQMLPIYGFGISTKAKHGRRWTTHDALPLNTNINWLNKTEKEIENGHFVKGLYGIEKLYLNTIYHAYKNPNFAFGGPTKFSQILIEANKAAKESLKIFMTTRQTFNVEHKTDYSCSKNKNKNKAHINNNRKIDWDVASAIKYHVLLIVTDGELAKEDQQLTCNLLSIFSIFFINFLYA